MHDPLSYDAYGITETFGERVVTFYAKFIDVISEFAKNTDFQSMELAVLSFGMHFRESLSIPLNTHRKNCIFNLKILFLFLLLSVLKYALKEFV